MAKKKAKKAAAKKSTKKVAKKAQKKTAKKKAASQKTAAKKKSAVKKTSDVTKKAKPKKAAAKKQTAKKEAAKSKVTAKPKTTKKEASTVKKKTVKASEAKTKTTKASTAPAKTPAATVTNISTAKKDAAAAPSKKEVAVSGGAATAAELKIQPKIIETPEPERMQMGHAEDIFSKSELEHFRSLLSTEKQKILEKAQSAMSRGNIVIERDDMYDDVDQASAMIEQNLTFRLLDRDRKLLMEIEHALAKIDNGEFGYCEGTGEPIPKRRLELRPWTRNSVKHQEKLERMRKSGRGVGDEDEM